jgi:hypothetical protein
MPGKAYDVAIGYDGKFIIADDRGKVCQWDSDNKIWKEIGRSPANTRKVMVVPKGYVYAIDKNSKVYKFIDGPWNIQAEDCRGDTGIEMINYSSHMLVSGARNLDKRMVFSW